MDSRCPTKLHDSSHEREKAAAHFGTAISPEDLTSGGPLPEHLADAHIRRNAHLEKTSPCGPTSQRDVTDGAPVPIFALAS